MDDDLFAYGGNKPLQFGSNLDESVDNNHDLLLELEDSDREEEYGKRKRPMSPAWSRALLAKKLRSASSDSTEGEEDTKSKSSKDSSLVLQESQDELLSDRLCDLSPSSAPLHSLDWQANSLLAAADRTLSQLSRNTPANDISLIESTDIPYADSNGTTIRVRCKGKLYKIIVEQDSLAYVAAQLSQCLNVRRDQLILQHKGQDIPLSSTLEQLGLSNTDIIDGFLVNNVLSKQAVREEDSIEVRIQSSNVSHVYVIGKHEPLHRILREFAVELEEDFDRLVFSFDGERIAANQSAFQLEMEDKDVIDARIT